ncbi:hypothetical protein OO306_05815 [Pseudomonas sp. DCB_AW]|uniref:hypothetical protein n=1 Tax=Pseudomonas sp. DCB_AW TaxID=2993596 RepID=UPI002248EED4|nr:hypothetical protein [Pseudomonas sp. DCB_AW]MCX2685068.1 hypothetical protein [Pseudomonas sp. DCB_AW]
MIDIKEIAAKSLAKETRDGRIKLEVVNLDTGRTLCFENYSTLWLTRYLLGGFIMAPENQLVHYFYVELQDKYLAKGEFIIAPGTLHTAGYSDALTPLSDEKGTGRLIVTALDNSPNPEQPPTYLNATVELQLSSPTARLRVSGEIEFGTSAAQ